MVTAARLSELFDARVAVEEDGGYLYAHLESSKCKVQS
jgi:hypothetical protein